VSSAQVSSYPFTAAWVRMKVEAGSAETQNFIMRLLLGKVRKGKRIFDMVVVQCWLIGIVGGGRSKNMEGGEPYSGLSDVCWYCRREIKMPERLWAWTFWVRESPHQFLIPNPIVPGCECVMRVSLLLSSHHHTARPGTPW